MDAAGTVSVVHRFICANPQSLIQGADGSFYGTRDFLFSKCATGGADIFKMSAEGSVVTTLHAFSPPLCGVTSSIIQASDGNFYGTAYCGSTGIPDTGPFGSVFKLAGDSTFTVLHYFTGGAGGSASGARLLVQAADGAFYGTAGGGASGAGLVYKITTDGTFTVLHEFAGAPTEPGSPLGALIQAADGTFYGTTSSGGTADAGTIYNMTISANVTVLHSFAGGSTDGANPQGALVQRNDGNFCGTTLAGGPANVGTVFCMTADGQVTILHAFTGGDEARPSGRLIQAIDGGLYGTTRSTGFPLFGVVFRIGRAAAANMSLTADFDGDRKSDLVVFRPATGQWFIRYSTRQYGYDSAATYQWGLPGDVPLVADFDGDGVSDLVVYRPGNGTWYIRLSSSGYSLANWIAYQWGLPGDIPLAADFDGDGKNDLVVYRPSTGEWLIRYSSNNYSYATWTSYQWGLPGDVPTVADFDGDRRTDLAVWRPTDGTWYIRFSFANYSYATYAAYQWGLPDDVPLVADVDGDGRADLAVWRPSNGTWYVRLSSSSYGYATFQSYQWGLAGDTPIPADFDGDSKTDLVVWRPGDGRWYLRFSMSGYDFTSWTSYQWGLPGDMPF
jgi:uncharacterized repeat protein (TIGR03803 family)